MYVSSSTTNIAVCYGAYVGIFMDEIFGDISWVTLETTRSNFFNTLRPRQDGRHFADDIFTCNFFNEKCCILIKFSLKYVRKGPIDNNAALVQIMAWCRSGDKPISEPMIISLPTHICVTRPQWVKEGTIGIEFTTLRRYVTSRYFRLARFLEGRLHGHGHFVVWQSLRKQRRGQI